MNGSRVPDTSSAVQQQQRSRISILSPAERLGRALALSELARDFAWAGALLVAGSRGPDAVRHRFLAQLFGADTANWVARRMAARPNP
ncbi:MAG: hypothetical protein ABIR59_10145 [Gemmatimonadales bacterium]